MKIEFKKCKNCNELFSNGRSDKIFCHYKCRNQFNNQKTQKISYNRKLKKYENILSEIDYLSKEERINSDEARRQFKGVDINSSDNFEVQMELLKHYDYLSRLHRVKEFIQSNKNKLIN
jgi:hypothetical protein